jgi:organic radical activating enzyme
MKKIVALEHKDPDLDNEIKIEWHIGLYCNNNCSYCSNTSHNNIPSHLNFDKFKRGVQNILNKTESNKIRIEFTGGEPTLNPNFYNMLKYLHNINRISFTTNGSRSIEYYKKCINLVNLITFSYHMEYNDFKPEMIIDLQKYIEKRKRKMVKVHVMFLPTTLDKVKELKNVFEKNNVKYVIRRIRPSYHKSYSDNEYWPDGRLKKGVIVPPFDTNSISVLLQTKDSGTNHSGGDDYYSIEELQFLKDESGFNFKNLIIHNDDGSKEVSNVNQITGDKLNQFKGWKCWAGSQSMRIGTDGNVTVGSCEIPSLGNVFTNFELPKTPLTCRDDWCCSATNINTTKIKNVSHIKKVRVGNR